MSNRSKKSSNKAEVSEEVGGESEFSGSESETKSTTKGGKGSSSTSKTKGSKQKKSTSGSKTAKTTKKSKTSSGSKKTKGGATKRKTPKEDGRKRYFKLIDAKTEETYGRYTGDTPKQAASKAFTKMLQKLKANGKHPPKQSTTIYLRESTRGSSRKSYGYEAFRQKLDEPQELVITDDKTGVTKTITYHYRNRIKKVPVPEHFGGARSKKSSSGSRSKKSRKETGKGKTSSSKKSSSKTSDSKKGGKTDKKNTSAKSSSSK